MRVAFITGYGGNFGSAGGRKVVPLKIITFIKNGGKDESISGNESMVRKHYEILHHHCAYRARAIVSIRRHLRCCSTGPSCSADAAQAGSGLLSHDDWRL